MSDPLHPTRLRPAPLAGAALLLLFLLALGMAAWTPTPARGASPGAEGTSSYISYLPVLHVAQSAPTPMRTYLPLLQSQNGSTTCPTASTVKWGQMAPRETLISGASTSPDLNMTRRGWYRVTEALAFAQYLYPPDEPPDSQHPLFLSHVVAGSTVASFTATYQVSDWDWLGCNCPVRRNPAPYPVTMLGLRTVPGQPLRIASRDLSVDPEGFRAMVIYADASQLALKYTWDDRVDTGYLVHLLNLCVDPNLVALYTRLNVEGRRNLPGVSNDSIVGTAMGNEVDVMVRDSGSFLDPRSWQDWWRDQPPPPVSRQLRKPSR